MERRVRRVPNMAGERFRVWKSPGRGEDSTSSGRPVAFGGDVAPDTLGCPRHPRARPTWTRRRSGASPPRTHRRSRCRSSRAAKRHRRAFEKSALLKRLTAPPPRRSGSPPDSRGAPSPTAREDAAGPPRVRQPTRASHSARALAVVVVAFSRSSRLFCELSSRRCCAVERPVIGPNTCAFVLQRGKKKRCL